MLRETLKASPACSAVTETTTESSGSALREAMVCSEEQAGAGADQRVDRLVRLGGMAAAASA